MPPPPPAQKTPCLTPYPAHPTFPAHPPRPSSRPLRCAAQVHRAARAVVSSLIHCHAGASADALVQCHAIDILVRGLEVTRAHATVDPPPPPEHAGALCEMALGAMEVLVLVLGVVGGGSRQAFKQANGYEAVVGAVLALQGPLEPQDADRKSLLKALVEFAYGAPAAAAAAGPAPAAVEEPRMDALKGAAAALPKVCFAGVRPVCPLAYPTQAIA